VSGDAYEPFIGRWSRLVAREFLEWLTPSPGLKWLDVGCGTGALSQTILANCSPAAVIGIDPSASFVAHAAQHVRDHRAHFVVGTALAINAADHAFDVAVAGLVLNFIPNPFTAVKEMARVARPGGVVAAYVWDYSDKMELLRFLWDAAVALDRSAEPLDEGRRFPLCRPGPLTELWQAAGLVDVTIQPTDVATIFRDFDDYWLPFLGGQGPAASYVAALDEGRRAAVRERVRQSLPHTKDGSIHLLARAWAVRGRRP
jgi:SAM-dependent methyltransferase